jgi:transposase
MLDRGMGVTEIANKIDGSQPAVSYIKKRWEKGLPPKQNKNQRTGPLNHEEIVSDRNSGMTLQQVADKHNTTKQTVFSICNKYS